MFFNAGSLADGFEDKNEGSNQKILADFCYFKWQMRLLSAWQFEIMDFC